MNKEDHKNDHIVEYRRISTQGDVDLLKCWFEDEELVKMSRHGQAPTQETYQNYIDTYSFFIYLDGMAVGWLRIFLSQITPHEGEIAISIAYPEYRGVGLGYVVGCRLIDITKKMGIKRLKWTTADYNLPSARLARKLGFKFYKLIPEVAHVADEKHDVYIYSMEI